jgi:hypothetical protein
LVKAGAQKHEQKADQPQGGLINQALNEQLLKDSISPISCTQQHSHLQCQQRNQSDAQPPQNKRQS